MMIEINLFTILLLCYIHIYPPRVFQIYAKFLLFITHGNALETMKTDNKVSVFYHESAIQVIIVHIKQLPNWHML